MVTMIRLLLILVPMMVMVMAAVVVGIPKPRNHRIATYSNLVHTCAPCNSLIFPDISCAVLRIFLPQFLHIQNIEDILGFLSDSICSLKTIVKSLDLSNQANSKRQKELTQKI